MFASIIARVGHLYDARVLATSPWIVSFDDFLTETEAAAFSAHTDESINKVRERHSEMGGRQVRSSSICSGECATVSFSKCKLQNQYISA